MRKRLLPILVLCLFLSGFSSCFKTLAPELVRYGVKGPFVSTENREKAEKLSKKFPDEAFYGNETEVLVEFYREGDLPRKKKSKKKGDKKKDERVIDEALKTELKAKVTYYHSVLAIKDFTNFSDAVYYNDVMSVSPIYVSYEVHKEKGNWSKLVSFSSSYEVDGLFYSDARLKSFTAPIPVRGTELHYTYTVTYENVNYLANLFFLEGLNTGKKNITFKVPDWLEMELIEKNLEAYGVSKNEKRPRNSRISEFRENLDLEKSKDNDDDEEEEEEETGKRKKGKKRVKYSYIQYEAKDLKASRREFLAAGPTYNQPHLLLSLKKYVNGSGTDSKLLSNVNDLYSWYRSLVKSVENDTVALAEKARSIVEGAATDEDKVKKLFYWVQDNVRYIAYEDGIAGFKPEACQKVFDNRYGDCKGMANLLTHMLRSLGYDARLTWIGTRRIAYDYSQPSLAVDNHMICTLILNGKNYFLDPTEDFIAFGDYAHRIQGRQVLIENGDTFKIDTIPNLSYERNKNDKIESFKLQGSDLLGKVTGTYRGESKTNILRYYNGVKSDRRATALERYLNDENINLKVSDIRYTPMNERVDQIQFDYQLTVKNQVLQQGNEWLVNLDWDREFWGLKIDSNRVADVDLGYKLYTNVTRSVELPEQVRLLYAPEKLDIKTENFRILMEYRLNGKTLTYTKTVVFYNGIIPVEAKDEWNEIHSKMIRYYSDYVVLTR